MENDWRSDLSSYFANSDDKIQEKPAMAEEKARDEQFLALIATPALDEIKVELEKYGREVTVDSSAIHASIKIVYQGHIEFDYSIHSRMLKIYPVRTSSENGSTFNAEGSLRRDAQDYIVRDMTRLELIQHCLKAYRDSRSQSNRYSRQ